MKVKQLIEKLKGLDKDMDIVLKVYDNDSSSFEEISISKLEKDEPTDDELYYIY